MVEIAVVAAAFFTSDVLTPHFPGAVLSQVFATFYDALKQAMGGSLTEFKPLKDLKATLDMLKPMLIENIEDHNNLLDLSNNVIEDLKREMQEGSEVVMKLAKCTRLQRLARLRYSRRIRRVDESLKGLIMELKLQETRDVKEVLLLVREQSEKINELMKLVRMQKCHKCEDSEEEDVKETLALATKRQVRLTRLISMHEVKEEAKSMMEVKVAVEDVAMKVELVQEEVDSEDEASSQKYATLAKTYRDLYEAVSEVSQQTKISSLTNYDIPLRDLKPLMEYVSNGKKKLMSSDVEVELENLKAKMEEGEKLVRACLNISNKYNPVKCFRHRTKLGENSGHLQRMLVSIYVALSESA